MTDQIQEKFEDRYGSDFEEGKGANTQKIEDRKYGFKSTDSFADKIKKMKAKGALEEAEKATQEPEVPEDDDDDEPKDKELFDAEDEKRIAMMQYMNPRILKTKEKKDYMSRANIQEHIWARLNELATNKLNLLKTAIAQNIPTELDEAREPKVVLVPTIGGQGWKASNPYRRKVQYFGLEFKDAAVAFANKGAPQSAAEIVADHQALHAPNDAEAIDAVHSSMEKTMQKEDIEQIDEAAKINKEKLIKLLYRDRSNVKEFGKGAGLTKAQKAAARKAIANEEVERVDEGKKRRKSAAERLGSAFDLEQQKSAASRKRGEEILAQARAKYAKKQAAKTNEEAEYETGIWGPGTGGRIKTWISGIWNPEGGPDYGGPTRGYYGPGTETGDESYEDRYVNTPDRITDKKTGELIWDRKETGDNYRYFTRAELERQYRREREYDGTPRTAGFNVPGTNRPFSGPGSEFHAGEDAKTQDFETWRKNWEKSGRAKVEFGKDAPSSVGDPVHPDEPKWNVGKGDETSNAGGMSDEERYGRVGAEIRSLDPEAFNNRPGDYQGDMDLLNKLRAKRKKRKAIINEEVEQINEAKRNPNVMQQGRTKIVKARVRGGKVQRRKKLSAVKGYTIRGGKLKRMSAQERMRRKRAAKRAKVKRKAKMARALMKRKRSMRRRASLGLKE